MYHFTHLHITARDLVQIVRYLLSVCGSADRLPYCRYMSNHPFLQTLVGAPGSGVGAGVGGSKYNAFSIRSLRERTNAHDAFPCAVAFPVTNCQ